jgi:hypothetical protein
MSGQASESKAKAEAARLLGTGKRADQQADIPPPGRYSIVYQYRARSGLYASSSASRPCCKAEQARFVVRNVT